MTLDKMVEMIKTMDRVKPKKYNKSNMSEEDILRYRKMINDENYLNGAIKEMADDFVIQLQEEEL